MARSRVQLSAPPGFGDGDGGGVGGGNGDGDGGGDGGGDGEEGGSGGGSGEGDGEGNGCGAGGGCVSGDGCGVGLGPEGWPPSSRSLRNSAVLPHNRKGPVPAPDKLCMNPMLETTRSTMISALRRRDFAAGALSASVLRSSARFSSRVGISEVYARHSGFQPSGSEDVGLRDSLGLSLRLIKEALALMRAVLYCRAKV